MSDPSELPLDALLSDVSVPPGLADRIKAACAADGQSASGVAGGLSDNDLDARLRAVRVPSAVLTRLREIPANESLDSQLVELPPPFELVHRLRRETMPQRLRKIARRGAQLALAASWFLIVSVLLAGAANTVLQSVYVRQSGDDLPMMFIYNGPLSLEAASAVADSGGAPTVTIGPLAQYPADVEVAHASTGNAGSMSLPIGPPEIADPPTLGPVAEWVSLTNNGLRPMEDVVLLRWGVLGSPQYADDALPELTSPGLPLPMGIEPPRVRGYDRAFFLKNRVFPPIAPSANKELASLAPPLISDSSALADCEQLLADGRRPSPRDVRVEDFLAAMDYGFAPAPAGKLALRIAAGPSVFGSPGANLLQVGVQAGCLKDRSQPATHLVLAIDLSHSMTRGGRLEAIQQGVDRLLGQLGRRDLLSLVVFDEEVTHLVEHASPDDAAELRELLAGLLPRGGTNLAAGLQQAASLAMTEPPAAVASTRLVLITDSQAMFDAATLEHVQHLLAEARSSSDVRLDVLTLDERKEPDAVLVELAQRCGGEVRGTTSPRQMGAFLIEALAGSSATVASDARLTLHFNPKAVAAYRLIGHEANAMAELSPPAVEAELLASEAATALVEIWFQSPAVNDIGHVDLTWNDPATGRQNRARQRIYRSQFATSTDEMAPSLQQAAIAAEVGEALLGSRDALRELGLYQQRLGGVRGVLDFSRQANYELRERPDFQRLLKIARRLNQGRRS